MGCLILIRDDVHSYSKSICTEMSCRTDLARVLVIQAQAQAIAQAQAQAHARAEALAEAQAGHQWRQQEQYEQRRQHHLAKKQHRAALQHRAEQRQAAQQAGGQAGGSPSPVEPIEVTTLQRAQSAEAQEDAALQLLNLGQAAGPPPPRPLRTPEPWQLDGAAAAKKEAQGKPALSWARRAPRSHSSEAAAALRGRPGGGKTTAASHPSDMSHDDEDAAAVLGETPHKTCLFSLSLNSSWLTDTMCSAWLGAERMQ